MKNKPIKTTIDINDVEELEETVFGSPVPATPEEDRSAHKERHIMLHRHLDELVADFITCANGRTSNTIIDLLTWSYSQTIKPFGIYEE